jgi:hypothetical protein
MEYAGYDRDGGVQSGCGYYILYNRILYQHTLGAAEEVEEGEGLEVREAATEEKASGSSVGSADEGA